MADKVFEIAYTIAVPANIKSEAFTFTKCYDIEAGNEGTAVNRSFKFLRKEPSLKRRRLKHMNIYVKLKGKSGFVAPSSVDDDVDDIFADNE